MNEPLISVIVPVYNPGIHLNRCLDSLVNQTYRNLEIILVDDGSTDGSANICKKYEQNDSRVKYIYQENSGVSRARNVGINNSKGSYFSFIDSDDYLELDTYEYLYNLIQKYQCDAVNFEHYITWSDKEKRHISDEKYYGLFDKKRTQEILLFEAPFAWSKIFRRKLVEGLRFDEGIARGEDSLFARIALDRAEKVWFDKRPLLHYVQSEQSAVRGRFRTSQLTALTLYDIYYPFYKEKYPELLYKFTSNMSLLLISLYYDMWNDDACYIKEQKMLLKTYRQYYRDAMKCTDVSLKQKIKQHIFRYAPKMFCRLHKLILSV